MIFWLPNFGGLWLALNAVLFQVVFCFAFDPRLPKSHPTPNRKTFWLGLGCDFGRRGAVWGGVASVDRIMIFWPPSFGGLWLALNAVLFQAVFRFAFVGGYVFISNQGGKWWGWVLPFFIPSKVQGVARIGSFPLCFACLPWLPLQAGACVGGLVGVFLGLSVAAVRVHLIIWTLVWIGV